MRHELPEELRLGDLVTFFAVHRHGSVTGAARALGKSPSHVSKTIARLEEHLQMVLVTRSVHGVALTEAALRVMPHLDEVIRRLRQVTAGDSEAPRTLTFAAPSYLVSRFLPVLAEAQPQLRFLGLEMPPAMLRAQAGENFFDVGLVVGAAQMPQAWQSIAVGEIRRALFARPQLAAELGPGPVDPERLLAIPFITPVYSVNGRFVEADDDCPLGYGKRRLGHKVQTLSLALALACRIDQLVFGPVLAARAEVERGQLVEIAVAGWRSCDSLALVCNSDRVLAHEKEAFVAAMRRALAGAA